MRALLPLAASLLLMAASFGGEDASPKPVRIAILGDIDKERVEVDCLTQRLSSGGSVELVERSEIDRIFKEHALSLNSDDSAALKACPFLGAQGMILIKSFEWEGRHVLSARLVATSSAAILDAWVQDAPSKEAGHFADAVNFKFTPLFQKLSMDRKDVLAISLLNLRGSFDKPELRELERKLTLLLSQRLIMEKGFIVLERWRLGNIVWEKELNLDSNPLWTGSLVLDGSVEIMEGDSAKVSLRLRRPGGAQEFIEVSGSTKDLKTFTEGMVSALKAKLGKAQEAGAAAWDMSKEADFYFKEAEWLFRAGAYEQAREAADAAGALGMKGDDIEYLKIKAGLEGIKASRRSADRGKGNERQKGFNLERVERNCAVLYDFMKYLEANPGPLKTVKFREKGHDWSNLALDIFSTTGSTCSSAARGRSFKRMDNKDGIERTRLLKELGWTSMRICIERTDDANFLQNCIHQIRFLTRNYDDVVWLWRYAMDKKTEPPYERMHIRSSLLFNDQALILSEGSCIEGDASTLDKFIEKLRASDSEQDRIDAETICKDQVKGGYPLLDEVLWRNRDGILGNSYYPCPHTLLSKATSLEDKAIIVKLLKYALEKRIFNYEMGRLVDPLLRMRLDNAEIEQLRTPWQEYLASLKSDGRTPPKKLMELFNKDAAVAKAPSSAAIKPIRAIDIREKLERLGRPLDNAAGFLSNSKAGWIGNSFAVSSCSGRGSFLLTCNGVNETMTLPPPLEKSRMAKYGFLWGGDDGKLFYAAYDGSVYIKDSSDWRFLAKSDFLHPCEIAVCPTAIFIAYDGDCRSEGTGFSGIVSIDLATGRLNVLSSSRRNPPLSPMDNCEPLRPKALDVSSDGRILWVEAAGAPKGQFGCQINICRLDQGKWDSPIVLDNEFVYDRGHGASMAGGSAAMLDLHGKRMVFNRADGAIKTFDPRCKGNLWKIAADGNLVYAIDSYDEDLNEITISRVYENGALARGLIEFEQPLKPKGWDSARVSDFGAKGSTFFLLIDLGRRHGSSMQLVEFDIDSTFPPP